MKLIKPSFEIIEQGEGREGIKKHIELCGRVCYKSEDRITGDSAEKFVQSLINSGHTSVLEHGTVYLDIPLSFDYDDYNNVTISGHRFIEYSTNPYSFTNIRKGNRPMCNLYVTTNYRVLLENNWLDDLQYLCEPTKFHEKRVTVRFICDRAIANEFVRHRTFSFSQESTRYCNYSQDKFGNELTFIKPCWLNIPIDKYTNITEQDSESGETMQAMLHEDSGLIYAVATTPEGRFLWNCFWDEHDYFDLLNQGWKPEQARNVLPLSLKTEIVMTGTIEQWKGFFELRTAENSHPQAQELAITLREEFIKRGY